MMPDQFSRFSSGLSDPGSNLEACGDAADVTLANTSRYLTIAVGGDLKVTTEGGQTATITVQAGLLPGRFTKIWGADAGSTATGVVAWW